MGGNNLGSKFKVQSSRFKVKKKESPDQEFHSLTIGCGNRLKDVQAAFAFPQYHSFTAG
jgi:hypothetical protein